MNPGELNKRIELGRFKTITNSEGFKEKVWEPILNELNQPLKIWAGVKNLYGKEFWEAKAAQKEDTVKFKCRYNKDINSKQYIKFQNNYYEIIHVDDIKYLHKEMEIKAKILEKDKI